MPHQSNRLQSSALRLHDPALTSDETAFAYCEPQNVSVRAIDLLPLLVDAALTNRAWLEDFAEDNIMIPQDLYEVLLAYRQYRRSA